MITIKLCFPNNSESFSITHSDGEIVSLKEVDKKRRREIVAKLRDLDRHICNL